MTLDDILNSARENTERPDSDTWREGLEILLHDHKCADMLSECGRSMMKNRYAEALAARMQTDYFIGRNPHVVDVPEKRPVCRTRQIKKWLYCNFSNRLAIKIRGSECG